MNMDSSARARVGDLVPDLTLPSLDGHAIALRGFDRKPLALFIWASW